MTAVVFRMVIILPLIFLLALTFCRRAVAEVGMTTIAGTGEGGFSGDDGPARQAQVSSPGAVRVDEQGNVFFVEGDRRRFGEASGEGRDRQRVRRIDGLTRVITTVEKPEWDSVPSNRRARFAGRESHRGGGSVHRSSVVRAPGSERNGARSLRLVD